MLPLEGRDTFIELALPLGGDTPSSRFLDKYGEGIYLVIYQIEDSLAMDERLSGLGIRYTTSRGTDNYTNLGFNSIWLHPGAMKGAFTQLSQGVGTGQPLAARGGVLAPRKRSLISPEVSGRSVQARPSIVRDTNS